MKPYRTPILSPLFFPLVGPLVGALALGLTPETASASASRALYDAAWSLPAARHPGALTAPIQGAAVVSWETTRGVPSLLIPAPSGPALATRDPELAAREHLRRHAAAYGLKTAAMIDPVIDGARLLFVHDTGRGGIIVALRQTVGGVDVLHGDLKVLLRRDDLRALAIAGSLHPAAHGGLVGSFPGSGEAAVARALGDLYGAAAAGIRLRQAPPTKASAAGAPVSFFDLSESAGPTAIHLREPARVQPVYVPAGDALIPGYEVVTQTYLGAEGELDGFQYVVAADAPRILFRRDLTAADSDAYTYTVWADVDGDHRPADGPLVDYTPHPTGEPELGPAGGVKPSVITIAGFNTNPDGGADPWLPPGATETVGNNVDAYVDHYSPSGFQPELGEFRASITDTNTFGHVYDIDAEPLATVEQSMAAIVQLFYDINWLHDYWYDSGFNEAAGNAQDDNYGRGGVAGDRIRGEAQDAALAGARNNANMMTPPDGLSPVMQMYLWTPLRSTASLLLLPSETEYTVSKGQFGPVNFDLTASLVMINGGVGETEGCEPATNELAGMIVVIDRGDCTFETKVNAAEALGAVAVIIVDNVESPSPPGLGNDTNMEDPTIPTVAVTMASGAAIKAAIADGPVSATIRGEADVERDGTIDNMIVAHEWGHYIHNRLVDCSSPQCRAMGEGWADFIALHMALREGEELEATYASQTYGGFDSTGYYGIRRVPYSVNPAKNALRLRHIGDDNPLDLSHPFRKGSVANSQVHNAGEVWASMMWEVYIALHQAHADDLSFDEVRRRLSDYVVAGMMMTPPAPTYLDQRDAMLIAISSFDEGDFRVAAEAFARRGAGTCAVAPPRESTNFAGTAESYELEANAALVGLEGVEGDDACDHDGVIDGGESGAIELELFNNGVEELPAGATVEILSPTPSLLFPEGATLTLPALPRHTTTKLAIPVALIPEIASDEHVTLTIRVRAPGSCAELMEYPLPLNLHADIVLESSTVDDVEVPVSPWTIDGYLGQQIWRRQRVADGHVWHGLNYGGISNTSLISPPLVVSASEPLVIAFDHAFSFEYSDGIAWDGGLLEVSTDDGVTWADVTAYGADPGYNGTITSGANPINGRLAFVDRSPGYPAMKRLTLDFGDALAGSTIHLRLRIGTDAAMGGPGWSIDNIAASGITNTPFPTWIPDQCGDPSGGSESGETETETDGGGSATASGGLLELEESGCGCTTDRRRPLGALWLVALGALLRRRRRGLRG